MNVPNIKKDEVMSLIYLAAILIFVFLIYKIFTGIGLIKTKKKEQAKEEKLQAAENLRGSEYFDIGTVNKLPFKYQSLGELKKVYAKDLRQAIRGVGTNEEKIFTIFSRLISKYNITEIAATYRDEYNRDLLTDLLNDLTAKEQVTLWGIIEKIPV